MQNKFTLLFLLTLFYTQIWAQSASIAVVGPEAVCRDSKAELVSDLTPDSLFSEPFIYRWYFSTEGDTANFLETWQLLSESDTLAIDSMSESDEGWYLVWVKGKDTVNMVDTVRFSSAFFLTMALPVATVDSVTLDSGALYKGVPYYNDTVLVDSAVNELGCDSISTIVITIGEAPVDTTSQDSVIITPPEPTSCSVTFDTDLSCGDTALWFTLKLDSGYLDSIRFTIEGHSGLYFPSKDSLQQAKVPVHLTAGKKAVLAEAFQLGSKLYETTDTINMLYPATVLYQKWNDFVGVLTKNFNDGYTFTSFQWYKNGEIIEGATEPYIYESLVVGDEYSVQLSDSLGHTAMTCPLTVVHKKDSLDYPVVVASRRKIQVCLPASAQVVVYDIQGHVHASQYCEQGSNWLQQSFAQGVYLVALYSDEKTKIKTYKILVR